MQEIIEKFFRGLGIELTSVTLSEEGNDVSIRIETPDSPLIIGMHGKNLEVFQHLLSRMIEKQIGHFLHLHLEVNDYMKSKDERLYRFLDSKIAFALESGKVLHIGNLNSYERKKAHNYIAEKKIEWLTTKSEWEWVARSLTISYTGTLKEKITPSPISCTSKIGDDLSEDGVGI